MGYALLQVESDPALSCVLFANLPPNALKYTRTRELAGIEVGVAQPVVETTDVPDDASVTITDSHEAQGG